DSRAHVPAAQGLRPGCRHDLRARFLPRPHGTQTSKDQYDRLVAEWLAGGRTSLDPSASLTVDELVLAYWKHAESYYRPVTLHSVRQALRRFRRLYGNTPAAEIGPLSLKTFRQVMVDDNLRRVSINKYVGWIRGMVRWAVEEELIPADRYHAVSAVRNLRANRSEAKESDPVTPVPEQHIDGALEHAHAPIGDMIRVQLLTGMRPGELCGMTPRDLDTTSSPWVYTPRRHKNEHHGKSRVIPIGPRAQSILETHLHARLDEAVFQPTVRRFSGTFEASHTRQAPAGYTTAGYRRAITRACELAGVPAWSPNRLRHNRATEVRRQFGVDGAGAVLGHSRLETTQIYAERNEQLASEIARQTG
ncbi:MAG: tyrosine-type recombinase/integrase, partial [Planctomycetota bacterium]